MALIKILLLGDSAVGKTSILSRYARDHFEDSKHPTIGMDFKISMHTLPDKVTNVKVQTWDTAGQVRFQTITPLFFQLADGFMLVCDLAKRETFDGLTHWVAQLDKHAKADIPKLIVGNKCDLKSDEREQVVDVKVSAKTGHNVKVAFDMLISQILDLRTGTSLASMPEMGTSEI